MSKPKRQVLFVVGTRPEAIKTAMVIAECQKRHSLETRVCTTGQHRELLDPFLEEFKIKPDVELGVMNEDQEPSSVVAAILSTLDLVLERLRPHLVVVQGDTSSALAAALAAFYRRIPVAHIEAGLRTPDLSEPWPEELNRRLVDRIATLHFAPTKEAEKNLIKERNNPRRIFVTGNPGIDALFYALKKANLMPKAEACDGPLVLVTMHRRENQPHGIEQVCLALCEILDKIPNARVVFPVHPNPRVRQTVERTLSHMARCGRLDLLPPLPYAEFLRLLCQCELVISDSGGLQEEAPTLGKPMLCTRDVTERPEGVRAGSVLLVGTEPSRIVSAAIKVLTDEKIRSRMSKPRLLYGDGRASARIADILASYVIC